MEEWRSGIGQTMRVFLILFVLGGLGMIIFGFVLQFPPASLPAGGMIGLGILTIMSALLGCCGSYGQDCCLKSFLSLSLLSISLQAAFVLALHLDFDRVMRALGKGKENEKVEATLRTGKWVFVGFLAAEGLALLLAIVIRCGRDKGHPFDQLEDPATPEGKRGKTQVALQKLRTDIKRSKEDGDSETYYERVRQKMEKKYGKFSHTVDWGKQKKSRWYCF